jgi:hypothetical protein
MTVAMRVAYRVDASRARPEEQTSVFSRLGLGSALARSTSGWLASWGAGKYMRWAPSPRVVVSSSGVGTRPEHSPETRRRLRKIMAIGAFHAAPSRRAPGTPASTRR